MGTVIFKLSSFDIPLCISYNGEWKEGKERIVLLKFRQGTPKMVT